MEQGIVSLLCHTAATGGKNKTGLLPQGGQHISFQFAEKRFAILCEDIPDGPAGLVDQCFIRIYKPFSAFFGQ